MILPTEHSQRLNGGARWKNLGSTELGAGQVGAVWHEPDVPIKRPVYIGYPSFRTRPGLAVSQKPMLKYWKPSNPWPADAHITGPYTRGVASKAWPWRDNIGKILLPYAPYALEARNQDYRRANGITAPEGKTPEGKKKRGATELHGMIDQVIQTGPDEPVLEENLVGRLAKKTAGLTPEEAQILDLVLEGKEHDQDTYHDRRGPKRRDKTRSVAEAGGLMGIVNRQQAGRLYDRARAKVDPVANYLRDGVEEIEAIGLREIEAIDCASVRPPDGTIEAARDRQLAARRWWDRAP